MTFIIAISESDSRKSCKHSSNSIKRITYVVVWRFFSYPHTYLLKKLVSQRPHSKTQRKMKSLIIPQRKNSSNYDVILAFGPFQVLAYVVVWRIFSYPHTYLLGAYSHRYIIRGLKTYINSESDLQRNQWTLSLQCLDPTAIAWWNV